MVKSPVVYESETWTMTEWYGKTEYMGQESVKKIYAPVAGQGMWRVRTNQELREPYTDLDTVTDFKKEWNG